MQTSIFEELTKVDESRMPPKVREVHASGVRYDRMRKIQGLAVI